MGLVIARPHGETLARDLLNVLAAAGVETEAPEVIPRGTPDDDALARIGTLSPTALLVPIHAHRAGDGKLLNGIDLVTRLPSKLREFVPILIPMTSLEKTVLDLALARPESAGGIPDALRPWLVPIDTDRLDEPEQVRDIVRKLAVLSLSSRNVEIR